MTQVLSQRAMNFGHLVVWRWGRRSTPSISAPMIGVSLSTVMARYGATSPAAWR